jgi:hypothetical protein
MTSPHPLPSATPSLNFIDAFTALTIRASRPNPYAHPRQSAPYGPIHTYTGFAAPGRERDVKRIDFVMMASSRDTAEQEKVNSIVGRGGWRVGRYACIDNWVEEGDVDGWEGRWSDHRIVRVELERV